MRIILRSIRYVPTADQDKRMKKILKMLLSDPEKPEKRRKTKKVTI